MRKIKILLHRTKNIISKLYRCPACGYYAYNGIECYDCGYSKI